MTTPASKYDQLFRRVNAARYVQETYGFPCSPKTLAKLACVGSRGPPFRKAGRIPLYPKSGLDDWAQSKIGPRSGPPPKCGVLPNLILEMKTRRHDFLGGIDVRTGLSRSFELENRTKRPPKTQLVCHLPLFSWRVAVVQPGTRAGLHPTKTAPRGQSTDRGHARAAPAAHSHDGQPVRQSIVRTDRSAALLARSSKRGRAVVDPAILFNVTVRGHPMPVGYPGRDDAAAGISINADLLGCEADPYQRRSAKDAIGQPVGESCVFVIDDVEINSNDLWLCCEATAEQIVRPIIANGCYEVGIFPFGTVETRPAPHRRRLAGLIAGERPPPLPSQRLRDRGECDWWARHGTSSTYMAASAL